MKKKRQKKMNGISSFINCPDIPRPESLENIPCWNEGIFFILSWGRAANVVYFIPYSTYSFSRVPFLQNLLFLFVLFPKHACTYVFFHHDNKLVFIFLDLTMSTVLLKRCQVSLGYCMYIKEIGNKNIFYFLFCVFSFVFGKGGGDK